MQLSNPLCSYPEILTSAEPLFLCVPANKIYRKRNAVKVAKLFYAKKQQEQSYANILKLGESVLDHPNI